MVFDADGVRVNDYANKFYRQMDDFVQGTSASDECEREFDIYPGCYPDPVTEVTLRIKHVERSTPKTHVTYEENWSGDRWTCRWGRHENPHNDRDHFHYPPSPDDNKDPHAFDADLGRDVLLMETPIEFILERMNHLATTDQLTYPSNYEWTMDYQEGRYHRPD